jgi:hypothetical protein
MTSVRCTTADQEICEITGTEPRQLQDWRRLGLVDHEVRSLGRGRGRAATYPPHAVDQIRDVKRLLALYGKLDLVTLALFGVGRNPTEKAFRKAFASLVESDVRAGHRMLAARDDESPAFSDRVRRGSMLMSRETSEVVEKLRDLTRAQAKDRIREDQQRQNDLQVPPDRGHVGTEARQAREDAIGDLVAALVDPDQSEGNERVLFEALGLAGDVIDDIDEAGGAVTFAEMQQVVDELSYKELIVARDEMRRGFLQVERFQGSPLFAFIATSFDDPAAVGVTLAMSVASGLAMVRRDTQVDEANQLDRSA